MPNKAPTAAMTPRITALSATFDAAASTDPDGSLTAYAWTFGDGTAGAGVSTSHTYATPGTYTVTLIVTDNEGATSRATGTVVATAPAPTTVTVASDTFAATRTNGWGAAVTGGTWTHAGLIGNYSTVGRQGTPGHHHGRLDPHAASCHDVSTTDADLRVTVSRRQGRSRASGSQLSFFGRKVGNYTYGARIKLAADGTATLNAMDNSTAIGSASLGAYTPGAVLNVRVQVTGINPTTIRAKAWAVGNDRARRLAGVGHQHRPPSLQSAGIGRPERLRRRQRHGDPHDRLLQRLLGLVRAVGAR